ncbi:glutamyl-tRNA reductase [Arthrobacter sp. NIO-1057]|uniref:glutamyl-tRNA reductase n=1 Tax=Arthrobacter sp. NIO-1057 TaxID=993071 RepID=UPI00071CC43F|nr:glutamyl-tRNA reductase [Arthrobacter sp. NIO-1057]KSU67057.1 glutamyl-tRNA reductase [Arthrobacter sp. NIO-1057]SCB95765.1 glutamyl-tRNA reductase [Arthrobacter sp. NIO-1057]
MVFLSLVASHSQLDLETVAQISASADGLAAASVNGSAAINGAVVLATCNRFEVYADVEQVDDATEHLVNTLADSTDLSRDFLAKRLTTLEGEPVIEHLFSVGAGLDSAVVGEREIAGQVRRALTQAQQEKTTTSNLTRLFQNATRAAKDVGSNTDLGLQGKSVVSVALDLAEELMAGDRAWSEQDVVLFGTGSYAGATMALLKERGVKRISVYSHSGRATDFTSKRGGFPLNEDLLPQALHEADVIVGCSGGGHQISRSKLEALRVKNHPLIAIDMALTHDFDPTLVELPDAELITLESVRMAAPTEQAMAVHAASRIVKKATAEFSAAQREREADFAIVALREHTKTVLEAEIAKVRAQHGCSAAAEEVELAMRRMVRQLLHIPTVRARELAGEGRTDEYVAALETLYGLELSEPETQAAKPQPSEAQASTPAASCPVIPEPKSA